MDLGTFSKRTLLTGAGFSRNWGGYTAAEMMGQILGHLQDNDEARVFWISESSFEEGLAKARAGQVSEDALQAIENAVLEAFKSLDRQFFGRHGLELFARVEDLLSRFYWCAPSRISTDTGYIFTLNQDLLMERRYINATVRHARDPILPGVRISSTNRFFSSSVPYEFEGILTTVMDEFSEIRLKKSFNYIKLHGSFNWRTATGGGSMILGNQKALQIAEQPLLSWYQDIFKAVLFAGDVQLMVVGYGFNDEHINDVIAEGIKEHRLKIMVWDRVPGTDWIKSKHRGHEIVAGLIGTESRDMESVFHPGSHMTESYRSICQTFFRTTD